MCPSPPSDRPNPNSLRAPDRTSRQAMDDDGSLHLGEHAVVDARIVVRAFRSHCQSTARHQDDAPARGLDRLDLLFIGADDVIDRHAGAGGEMVRAGAEASPRPAAFWLPPPRARSSPWPAASRGPCPLGRIHGLRDRQPESEKIVAEAQRRFPVDRRRQRWTVVGKGRRRHARPRRLSAGRRGVATFDRIGSRFIRRSRSAARRWEALA